MSDGIKTHKDLTVWQEAMKLSKEVYQLTSRFPKKEVCYVALGSLSELETQRLLAKEMGMISNTRESLVTSPKDAFRIDPTHKKSSLNGYPSRITHHSLLITHYR
ncbi:MAG TPA: four helix bundle protein [Desulfatiglandales bacterium]|nr:four helix bundle protein [Desulfatiglandales bacterium]